MSQHLSRRYFVRTTLGAGVMSALPVAQLSANVLNGDILQPSATVEKLTTFIETTSRSKVIEGVARQVRDGLQYKEFLAALLLAGVRNIEPRPTVGFQFHAVLVVHSAHLTSLSSPVADRWLPAFWALDNFKSSQATDARKGMDWKMQPVDSTRLPGADKAVEQYKSAMEGWQEDSADLATVSIVRSLKREQLFELMARYAARDLRSIGHKAIFMANGFRTLDTIGWEHAESVLRSLTYAMLNHRGEPNPAESDLEQDRPWRRNLKLADKIRNGWKVGNVSDEATRELLSTLRTGSANDASDHVLKLLNEKVAPQSIIDALFVGAGELMMRQTGIPAIHAVTTSNAVHYLFQNSNNDHTRRMLLLQWSAFLPLFRKFMLSRGKAATVSIDAIDPLEGEWSVEQLLETGEANRSVSRAIHALGDPQLAKKLIDEIRRRTFLHGRDAHHYKFSAASLEDYRQVSASWRSRFLASSLSYVPGGAQNRLVEQVREAVK